MAVISFVNSTMPSAVLPAAAPTARVLPTPTPSKVRTILPSHLNGDNDGTPRSSPAATPPPNGDEAGTPHPSTAAEDGGAAGDDLANTDLSLKLHQPDTDVIDRTLPIMPLESAILTSIEHASGNDERRRRDLLGSIMLIGGASKTPFLGQFLEARLRAALPQYPKEILVAPPPRELDPAVLVWKGASVFGKLRMTNDSWIGAVEYDRLGGRVLNYKVIWHW